MRVGFLGPYGTISQEAAEATFENPELIPQATLNDVVKSVASEECDFGIVPYYNTHERHIHVVRQAIAQNRNLVFVNRMYRHSVTHCLYSYGSLESMEELWSKNVVFSQISEWVAKNAPSSQEKHFESTAKAVASACRERSFAVGAVGSKLAARYYSDIPLLATGIENKGNFTIFAILSASRRHVTITNRLLLMGFNMSKNDQGTLFQILLSHHLRVASMDPALSLAPEDPSIMIFEIDSDPTFNLSSPAINGRQAFLTEISQRLPNFSLMGGFVGPSLTALFNSHES